MTINWEKLKKYRESQQPGVGKTFNMLVEAVEYIRDNRGHDILVICKSTLDIRKMKETMKAIAVELRVSVEGDFNHTLVLNESHVLFGMPGAVDGIGRDQIYVDHSVLEMFVLGQKNLSQK